MWKRLQGHVRDGHFRDKDRQIGSPVLVETTYDEDQLRHMANVAQAQNASYQPHASSAPQPYADLHPPQYGQQYRASEVPTVSSVYSQPSPELRYGYHRPSGDQHFDISPPSSPEPDQYQQENPSQPRRFRSMRDVSPVDENRGKAAHSPPGGSHIPVMRKAPPGLRDQDSTTATQKFWGGKVAPNSKVLWDEYSGEPTSSNAGKAARVTPGSFQKEASPPSARLRETGYDVSVTANSRRKQTLAERANRYGPKPAPVDTRPREPWSRAIGRAEIVKPFKDQPSDKPLNVRKADNQRAGGVEKTAPNSLRTGAGRVSERADTTPVADTPVAHNTHEEPIKPVVPLKVARTSPSREFSFPTSPEHPLASNPYTYSPITPTNNRPAGPTNTDVRAKAEPAQPRPTTPTTKGLQKPSESTPGSTGGKDNGATSRFSWTTYSSSTTYQHSPPPSPPPPLPVSRVPAEPVSAASAILSRKRPTQVPDRVPARKPIGSSAASTARNTMISDGLPSPRPDSTFSTSTNKDLPRPPTELAAADHIEVLESQMEDLKVRRTNVYKLLNDLNNMAPPNPMITDFKRMRLVDQRKKDFENELAEIKREEHDVGLKLHRAWRKRENADPAMQSTLWVRRVTR
ncbi:hypothetical protein BU23DRAFT_577232 [Bimuria novae-zelandiae CBS 107.79]|uniref:Uncharacterized protein n=1 Tax=Bimuria novae-zelandiae CBS 107.79 TaxID=1447943 RepID=A0A6A5VYS9_9PLEO|nr:hypothetical protein BU23DRAFT_577232 [Bimuria novae-zelandiae CBS 107.79]